MLALTLLLVATHTVASVKFCTFTNSLGDHCRQIDANIYNTSWCTGRAKGFIAPSCLRVWVAPSVQQVFEETIANEPELDVDWAAQQGEAEHVQIALR